MILRGGPITLDDDDLSAGDKPLRMVNSETATLLTDDSKNSKF